MKTMTCSPNNTLLLLFVVKHKHIVLVSVRSQRVCPDWTIRQSEASCSQRDGTIGEADLCSHRSAAPQVA